MEIKKDDLIFNTYRFKKNDKWCSGTKINNELFTFDEISQNNIQLFDYCDQKILDIINAIEVSESINNNKTKKIWVYTPRDINKYNIIIMNQNFIDKLLNVSNEILCFNGLKIKDKIIPVYILKKEYNGIYFLQLDECNNIIDYTKYTQ